MSNQSIKSHFEREERKQLTQWFGQAMEAMRPQVRFREQIWLQGTRLQLPNRSLELNDFSRIWIFGAGKAAGGLAQAAAGLLGNRLAGGVVICPEPEKFTHTLKPSEVQAPGDATAGDEPDAKKNVPRATHTYTNKNASAGNLPNYEENTPVVEGTIEFLPGDHPVPLSNSEASTTRLLERATQVEPGDLVLCMITGGASAMLCKPVAGVSLSQKQQIHTALLRSGASIHDMNTVRKHLSAVKGGKLLRAFNGARVINFLISDVPGDDPRTIGSGPTNPDVPGAGRVRDIIDRYLPGTDLPIFETMSGGDEKYEPLSQSDFPTGATDDSEVSSFENVWICTPSDNATYIASLAEKEGFRPFITANACEGPIVQVADQIFADIQSVLQCGTPTEGMQPSTAAPTAQHTQSVVADDLHSKPAVLIYFGESEVKVSGDGKGGRNQHLALLLAERLGKIQQNHPHRKITILSAGTDGGDGNTDAAGAICTELTAFLARKRGVDCSDYINSFDSHTFFNELGDIFHTGPTGNNLMDLQMVLIS